MNVNAPGQLLGYALQFPRALYHLLRSKEGDSVCIEVLGDVAQSTAGGDVKAEEDKSSISSNPITDRSTNLWKTFYNWIKAIEDGELDIESTTFILYCNHSGKESLAHQFSNAGNGDKAVEALEQSRQELADVDESHEIWKFFSFVSDEKSDLFVKVIERFELQVGSSTGFDEVREELKAKFIHESQIDFVSEKISGWLQEKVMSKIAENEPAVISWSDFSQEMTVCFQRAQRRELFDFAKQFPPSKADIKGHLDARPLYVQQLDKIEIGDDEVIRAVTDFMKADINREKWIESEIIDEDVAADFEDRLREYWNNMRQDIDVTQSSLDDLAKGKSLYLKCKMRQEPIREVLPPISTISGTYHALADQPVIGWHADWKLLIPEDEDV